VAILFLAGGLSMVSCPVPAAVPSGAQVRGTGRGAAFFIQTDVPVVAYQMLPYGGGSADLTGASLLLPASSWGTNYLAVNPGPQSAAPGIPLSPSLDIVAAEDGTKVTILPKAAIVGGNGVPASAAGTPVSYTLSRGELLQITQPEELTGSPIQSDKPIGVWAAHTGLHVPIGTDYADHMEQQIPPIRALGHQYVAVGHRDRQGTQEVRHWRIVGAVDGTALSYEPSVGAPSSVGQGQVLDFETKEPFVVRSQDDKHPFLVFAYMSGAAAAGGHGDPDFVRIVPPAQFLARYVFFADPTYPETNLIAVRQRKEGAFAQVTLDCSGAVSGWKPVGASGDFEWASVDLTRDDFVPQGGCSSGRRVMESTAPFGLWVWGWGSPKSSATPCDPAQGGGACVSYGYPAGEGVLPINDVVVPPQLK
jgi:hypothetical protein